MIRRPPRSALAATPFPYTTLFRSTRDTLDAAGTTYGVYSLAKAAEKLGDISRLPFSMKVLLENLLRFEDGKTVTTEDLQAIVDWQQDRRSDREIQYRPDRKSTRLNSSH